MKKNNKGFFLAETLIVISLVTLILAFVYPNLSKLYETFILKTNYYDQIEDIQSLKTIDFVYNEQIENLCANVNDSNFEIEKKNVVKVDDRTDFNFHIVIPKNGNYDKPKYILRRIYLTKYNTNATFVDSIHCTSSKMTSNGFCDKETVPGGIYALNRYMTRIRQTKLTTSCRLVGVYEFDNNGVQEFRYASVEHIKY